MGIPRNQLWLVCTGLFMFVLGCAPADRVVPRATRNREGAERLNEQGLQWVDSRAYDKAERCFRQAIECDPFCGPAHCNLGITLMQLGRDPFDAAWSFRHAAQLMPKAIAPRVALGQLLEKAGQLGAAEQVLRDALSVSPDEIEVVGHLARIHVRQNKLTDETRSWLQIVAAQNADSTWRTWAQQCLAVQLESPNPNEDTP